MFHIVLYEPEIPHNTGAAGRLALATNSTLHLIEPLGFSIDEKQVRRTGLDYWQHVNLKVWSDFQHFLDSIDPSAQLWYLSTKATDSPWTAPFRPGDYLIFGKETKGLPEDMVQNAGAHALRIPMVPDSTRSLNLATAIGIVLYEAVRQQSPNW